MLSEPDEDIRSLKELIIYGLKGMAAYVEHAAVLGFEDNTLYGFMMEALSATTQDLSMEELIDLVFKTGEKGVDAMSLLGQGKHRKLRTS